MAVSTQHMPITVEFFGIARKRAGVGSVQVEAARLEEAIKSLSERYPALAESCFQGNAFRSGFAGNLNGDRFVSDPTTPLKAGDTLLILSADAGG